MNIEEKIKEDLINAVLRGKGVTIFSKERSSDVLRKYEGTVIAVEPLERIICSDSLAEKVYLPFCSTSEGILMIMDKEGNVFYRNDKVLEAHAQKGYDNVSPMQIEEVRKNVSRKGVFYVHTNHLPSEIHF